MPTMSATAAAAVPPIICTNFANYNKCKFGASCRYSQTHDEAIVGEAIKLATISAAQKGLCRHNGGSDCTLGVLCGFKHNPKVTAKLENSYQTIGEIMSRESLSEESHAELLRARKTVFSKLTSPDRKIAYLADCIRFWYQLEIQEDEMVSDDDDDNDDDDDLNPADLADFEALKATADADPTDDDYGYDYDAMLNDAGAAIEAAEAAASMARLDAAIAASEELDC